MSPRLKMLKKEWQIKSLYNRTLRSDITEPGLIGAYSCVWVWKMFQSLNQTIISYSDLLSIKLDNIITSLEKSRLSRPLPLTYLFWIVRCKYWIPWIPLQVSMHIHTFFLIPLVWIKKQYSSNSEDKKLKICTARKTGLCRTQEKAKFVVRLLGQEIVSLGIVYHFQRWVLDRKVQSWVHEKYPSPAIVFTFGFMDSRCLRVQSVGFEVWRLIWGIVRGQRIPQIDC